MLIATRPINFRRGGRWPGVDGIIGAATAPFQREVLCVSLKASGRMKMLVYAGTGGADLGAARGSQVHMAGDQRRGDAAVDGATGSVV